MLYFFIYVITLYVYICMYTSRHTVLHGLAAILFLKHILIYIYMSYVQENAAGNSSLAICSRKQLETICNIDLRVPANVNNYIYICIHMLEK